MSDETVVETTKNEAAPEPVTAAPAAVKAEKAPKTPKTPKEPKGPRSTLLKQNGVSRPGGGVTAQVWEIADALSADAGAPAPRKAVMEKGTAAGINVATLATQYGRWRRFNGLSQERTPKAPEAGAVTAPAVPADTSVEAPKA